MVEVTALVGTAGASALISISRRAEAMFEAATAGEGDWIAVSADPAHTTERTGVPAVPGLGGDDTRTGAH